MAVETTWTGAASADWLDPANWTNGVPNAADDVAELPAATLPFALIASGESAVLGRLAFTGAGGASIDGEGEIAFQTLGSDPPLILVAPPANSSIDAEISPVVAIRPGELLHVDVAENSALTLLQGTAAGDGDLRKIGAGRLILDSGSADWNGHVSVVGGALTVNAGDSLGSADTGTLVDGGSVLINASTAEPFTLQAGELQTTTSHPDLNGDIHLLANNTALLRGPFDIRGESTGEGDLSMVVTQVGSTIVEASLNHEGGVFLESDGQHFQRAIFGVDNGYLGPTVISGTRLEIQTPNGLGGPSVGTTVTQGLLRLHGASEESVSLTDATLELWSLNVNLPELRPAGDYTLHNSTLTTYGDFGRGADNYVVESTVQLSGDLNTFATERGNLTLQQGVTGTGKLVIEPDGSYTVNLAGPIDESIALEVRSGPAHLQHENAYSGQILLSNSGRLVVESNQTLYRIRTGSFDDTRCCGESGTVDVVEGAALHVDRLDLNQGLIRGTVHVADGLHFHGMVDSRTISHVDTAADVSLYGGKLTIDDSEPNRAPTNGAVTVMSADQASIVLAGDSVTDVNLNLNNGSGFGYGGALRTENDGNSTPTIVLRGDIDLGEQGAHIGGWDGITVEGQIRGGDLHLGRLLGTPTLILSKETMEYTGKTNVYSGDIQLIGNAALQRTSGIDVYDQGALYIDSSATDGPTTNRVADDIPIRLLGGEVSTWSTEPGVETVERIGQVQATRGLSALYGTLNEGSNEQALADLAVGELERMPGAVVTIRPHQYRDVDVGSGTQTSLTLENPPEVVNGILPAWFNNGVNFTTLDIEGRVVDYDPPEYELLNSADENSVARPPHGSSPSTLSGDKTIHALYAFGSTGPVDLDGHTLTIGSGGVSGAQLLNGTIQPGQFANGELIFFGGTMVDADIVDNGDPTSVVYVGEAEIGGNNSYTGSTYIVGRPGDDVEVTNAAALPQGTDLEINGYVSLRLRDLSGGVSYQFGSVAIRNRGMVIGRCCGAGDTLMADSIKLEDGVLSATLTGDMPIVKQTTGTATILYRSPAYTGQIDVLEGLLLAGDHTSGYLALGGGTVNVGPNGRLALNPVSLSVGENPPLPQIRLNGGSLFATGDNPSNAEENLRGTLEVHENSAIYLFDAVAVQPSASELKIAGEISVAANKSLAVIGHADTSRSLQVSDGIHLEQGSVLAGTGSIRARVQIADGAVISPGLLEQGNSVGMLRNSMTGSNFDFAESLMIWGEGGRYRWEMNDAAGDPGAPFGRGWDLLRVGELLEIEATSQDRFVIEPVGLGVDGDVGAVEGLSQNTHHRWLIAEKGRINAFSADIQGFAADKFVIDVATFQQSLSIARPEHFWLDLDEEGIHLNAIITPGFTGDFNGDGVVDVDDLNNPTTGWETRFGAGLDGASFLLWQRQFGSTIAAEANIRAPEPPTVVLSILCIAAGCAGSSRRKKSAAVSP